MEALKRRINKKNFYENIQKKFQNLSTKENSKINLRMKSNEKIQFNGIDIYYKHYSKTFSNIKDKKVISSLKDSDDIFQKIKMQLLKEEVSYTYHKNITKLFENFIEYLLFIKKNAELINNFKRNGKLIIKRIKIKDLEDFLVYKYKNATPSTLANIKSRMRKFVRIINNEPKLDYYKKIVRPKIQKDKDLLTKKEIVFLLEHFNNNNDISSLIIFYLLYFVGLNYSFLSRLLIKNFLASFRLLKIKKGSKILKHRIPIIIAQLFHEYFIGARSPDSFFLKDEHIRNNSEETRTSIIKSKIKSIFEKIEFINEEKKIKILSIFSYLRRAKNLTKDLYEYFILPNMLEKEKKENETNIYSNKEKTLETDFNRSNVSQSLDNGNNIEENFFPSKKETINDKNIEKVSIDRNFDISVKQFNKNDILDKKSNVHYLNRKKCRENKFGVNKRINEFL